MSKPGVAFGLSFGKKAPVPRKTKAIFGDDDDDDDGSDNVRDSKPGVTATSKLSSSSRQKPRLGTEPPKLKPKTQTSSMFGDLSANRTSRKNAQTAQDVDPSVYEYDAVYDSMKPKKHEAADEVQRKPQYLSSMLQAAEVRKRDKLIAEEKKIAREREAEGDEFADKEKFVTAAYKRQQEENKRIEEEEKRREEKEARESKGRGMAAFYKNLLDRDEERHAAVVKAAEELAKKGPRSPQAGEEEEEEEDREKAEAALARKLRQEGIAVEINEDGQVVDKRQLLQSGLNVGAKTKEAAERDMAQARDRRSRREAGGGRQTSRQQESRMFEDQLEQLLKRSRGDDDDDDDDEDGQQSKSRKTER
ncbi:hypothetical protein CDD81_779 [Ophiocordyceps australis]|uniref:Nuclear speckle splicing regulatory protein 1 N-terminal domain-containing protein n=1 Tax=Ophiocordyceps australis TaxID=1399860 RepID=A0A2C5XXC9_9HYPO|nr:hypothetical protein CDD81_779 [Ophiocordyceps australis]